MCRAYRARWPATQRARRSHLKLPRGARRQLPPRCRCRRRCGPRRARRAGGDGTAVSGAPGCARPRTALPAAQRRRSRSGKSATSALFPPRRSARSKKERRSAGSSSMPSRMPSLLPVLIARSIAMHQSAQASPASGSACVKPDTAIARSTRRSSSPRAARATGAVLMRLPLPALRSGCPLKCSAAREATSDGVADLDRTDLVWMPTSAGPDRYHSRNPAAIASRSGDPVAVSSAMQMAIWVSSVHSPGAQRPSPPPFISASPVGGAPNS